MAGATGGPRSSPKASRRGGGAAAGATSPARSAADRSVAAYKGVATQRAREAKAYKKVGTVFARQARTSEDMRFKEHKSFWNYKITLPAGLITAIACYVNKLALFNAVGMNAVVAFAGAFNAVQPKWNGYAVVHAALSSIITTVVAIVAYYFSLLVAAATYKPVEIKKEDAKAKA